MDSRPKLIRRNGNEGGTQDQRPGFAFSFAMAGESRVTSHACPFLVGESRKGSAIILAIVLTSLLAIVGVLFLISSRIDLIATSSIADSKDLTLAVDSVIAQISRDLIFDVTRSGDPNYYADYPDERNFWLACLEPYSDAGIPKWRQVSNIYTEIATSNVEAIIIPDYQPNIIANAPADADGDGVSDSNWIRIPAKSSSKGKPIFAAVRIIDNAACLNVNTGFKFDPVNYPASAFGASQMDINLMAFAERDHTHMPPWEPTDTREDRLLSARCGTEPTANSLYEQNVIWRYEKPAGVYTPFDVSDELNLRYRYILLGNNNPIVTRSEDVWTNTFKIGPEVPRQIPTHDITNPNDWFWIVNHNYPDFCPDVNKYDFRHIATTYNCDRVITPAGNKMININNPALNAADVCDAVKAALIEGGMLNANADFNAAQIAINLLDYVDTDSIVSTIVDGSGLIHFGFEQPCAYISELAENIYQDSGTPPTTYYSYAIEIYKPYPADELPTDPNWQLVIDGRPAIPVNWSGSNAFHVLLDENGNNPISPITFTDADGTPASGNAQDASGLLSFGGGYVIELQRRFYDPSISDYRYVTVDKIQVPADGFNGTDWLNPMPASNIVHSFQRDISSHKPIRRLWDGGLTQINSPTLGSLNSYTDADSGIIQAHPTNNRFTNIGEIGQLFYAPTYSYGGVGPDFAKSVTEPEMRLNLADPNYQRIFKYLTVMDPCNHGVQADGESRIKGRININTAPWFVIAQLPWISDPALPANDKYKLAKAIVAYRDKLEILGSGGIDYDEGGDPESRRKGMGVFYPVREDKGFASVGELMNVINGSSSLQDYDIRKYAIDVGDLIGYPDISTPAPSGGDDAMDDFEERDVIFARISNLVTVRSDVFTAYILVRIGQNGPQKRVIAILDRSGVVPDLTSPTGYRGKVKIIAVQPVPDPR